MAIYGACVCVRVNMWGFGDSNLQEIKGQRNFLCTPFAILDFLVSLPSEKRAFPPLFSQRGVRKEPSNNFSLRHNFPALTICGNMSQGQRRCPL